MAYDKDKFEALRSLEVPYKIALALADESSPLNALAENVPPLAGDADLAAVRTKVNDLIAALVAAGLMEEPA